MVFFLHSITLLNHKGDDKNFILNEHFSHVTFRHEYVK